MYIYNTYILTSDYRVIRPIHVKSSDVYFNFLALFCTTTIYTFGKKTLPMYLYNTFIPIYRYIIIIIRPIALTMYMR